MTKEDRKALVQKVIDRHVAMGCVFDALTHVVGECVDSPLWGEVWATADLLIEATSKLIGDEFEWLAWFINENDCGEKQLEAGFDGDLRRIGSVDDLLWLIELEAAA